MPLAPLSQTCDVAALVARRSAEWRPGLARMQGAPCHSEVFASAREASGAGAALALALDDWRNAPRGDAEELEDRRAVLWVQTREAARLTGLPYRAGLPPELRHRVIHVLAEKAKDALFALEEGVRCREIAFVIGELAGNPGALDFTASRRLTLAAEKHGVPLYLVRLDAARDLSSARMRWEVAAAVSPSSRWNATAPGTPSWQAELFRARAHAPGEWLLRGEDGRLVAERASGSDEAHGWAAGLRHAHPLAVGR
jgi:protein ImuA